MSRKQLRVPLKGKPAAVESLAASFDGIAYNVEYIDGFSIVAGFTGGTAAGTFKIQMSNNAFLDNVGDLTPAQIANPDAVWVDLPGMSGVVAGAGSQGYNIADVEYEAFRYVYTRTGGTGSVRVYILGKGQY